MDTQPKYNLNHIVRETGIKPDTLRAWESRYGLPKPERTSGGHRLFSEFDLYQIRWLLAKKEEGISIGRAVKIWQDEHAGPDGFPDAAVGNLNADLSEGRLAGLREQWIRAVMDFNESAAETILNQAFSIFPVHTVSTELLQKAISEIGQMWYRGDASVQQEHFASELAVRRLQALIANAPAAVRKETILVGCPPGEMHTFPLLVLNLLLRYLSWNVIYLGANIPNDQIEEAVESIRPDMVVMVAMSYESAAALKGIGNYLHSVGIPLAYGGSVFTKAPNIVDNFPGYYLGDFLGGSVKVIEDLLIQKPEIPPPVLDNHWASLIEKLENNHASLEMAVVDYLTDNFDLDFPISRITEFNERMHTEICATLKLGSIDYLGINLGWVKFLLSNRQISEEVLEVFLRAWRNAIDQVIGPDAERIVYWLENQLETELFGENL